MRLVTLPILPITATLAQAFEAMTRAARSAVVSKMNLDYRLYAAPDIVIAGAEKPYSTLRELVPTEILHVPTRDDVLGPPARRYGGVTMELPLDRATLEQALDRAGRQFGILADVDDTALIMTRHEGGAAPYDPAPSKCYCTVDRRAVPAPPGVDHGPCPYTGVHGPSVRCIK